MKNALRLLLVSLAVCACSGSLTPQAFCAEQVQVTCAKLFECAASQVFTSEADCVSKVMIIAECQSATERRYCGNTLPITWDAAAAARCIDELRTSSCGAGDSSALCITRDICGRQPPPPSQ
jgi:hypothetical protein